MIHKRLLGVKVAVGILHCSIQVHGCGDYNVWGLQCGGCSVWGLQSMGVAERGDHLEHGDHRKMSGSIA